MGGVEGPSPRRRSPLRFILLVFALSVPFWAAGAVTGGQLTENLPLGALMAVCPVTAAAILVYREEGPAGVTKLLRRSFDYKRIKAKAWYVPILLLTPGVYALTYALMGLAGSSVPNPQFPVLTALAMILSFYVLGLGEELGWSGYAIDPLQSRWGAFRAAVLLGFVWAVWHYVPLPQAGRSAGWIAWWSLSTVALRVLITWIYNNNGKSVSSAATVHAMTNVLWVGPFLDFGSGGYPYQAQAISALLMAAAAAAVTIVWGPRTLTRHGMGRDRRTASAV
jgi:membrane protease YdiL (CAAX protease family)